MAKKIKIKVQTVKCECSKCGQVSFVEANTQHFSCRGFKIVKPLPAMFLDLHGKVKGTWKPYTEGPTAQTAKGLIAGFGFLLALPIPTEEEIPS
jgi:hypothetical protein